jgi:hypothetical protein
LGDGVGRTLARLQYRAVKAFEEMTLVRIVLVSIIAANTGVLVGSLCWDNGVILDGNRARSSYMRLHVVEAAANSGHQLATASHLFRRCENEIGAWCTINILARGLRSRDHFVTFLRGIGSTLAFTSQVEIKITDLRP